MADNYPPFIFGLHDRGGEFLMLDKARPGWVLVTEGIGADPSNGSGSDYTDIVNKGMEPIARLNFGYGSDGTIPHSSLYDNFARRCGNFVQASPGCHKWIIGNEMNHPAERPGNVNGQGGEVITPQKYASCYNKCRTEIRRRPGHEADQVIVGAVAPYNVQTTYPGNEKGNFQKYLADILAQLSSVDGISLHSYTHGPDPALVISEALMGPPVSTLHFNFRVYRDFMAAIPARLRTCAVYITETDQDTAWLDQNNGWVQAAYKEIDDWNQSPGHQPIQALILYRWIIGNPSDQQQVGWAIENKPGVQAGFRDAMNNAYRVVLPRGELTYRASWVAVGAPTRMDPGAQVTFPVTVRNDGTATWADTGADAVQIGHRWINAAGQATEGPRTGLPGAVAPNATVRLPAVQVQAPAAPGMYTLELDMVRGESGWFAAADSPVYRVTGILVGPRHKVTWLSVTPPARGTAGQTVLMPVRMRNDGTLAWTPLGDNPFDLSYKWLDQNRNVIVADGRRTPLPGDVPPGGEVSVNAQIQLPTQAGIFILQLDMIHEHITWFKDQGSPPFESTVEVKAARPDYAAQWLKYTGPQKLLVGQAATAVLQVKNVGAKAWPAAGAQAVTLGHRWLNQQGQVVAANKASQTLSANVAPDATVTFTNAAIAAVPAPGNYRLVWDLVQGGKWLSEAGSAVMEVLVQVSPPPYGVAWQVLQPWPAWMRPGEVQRARLRLTNTGSLAWASGGATPVHVAYHWFTTDGRIAPPWDTFRLRLPGDVNPGASVDLDVPFDTPSVPARYTLRWDLVQEGVTWFYRAGAAPLQVPIEVSDQAIFVRWTAQASHNSAEAALALDANPQTWWDSGDNQAPGMWFQVDLGDVRMVHRFKAASPSSGYPVAFNVKLSEDGQNWRLVAAADKNWRDVDVAFVPRRARYVRLEQTGTPAYAVSWKISDVAIAIAEPWTGADTSHNPAAALQSMDGRLDTAWNTGALQKPGMWYQVSLGFARSIERVQLIHPLNQQPRGYVVQISGDGQTWQDVGRKDDNWGVVDVTFPAATAAFVRVQTTNSSPYHPWGIAEFIVWEANPTWLRGQPG